MLPLCNRNKFNRNETTANGNLEHSRILIFANGGQPKYHLGSADWMPRNLVNRIEVLTPVYDEDLQRDLMRTIDYGLRDTINERISQYGLKPDRADVIIPAAEIFLNVANALKCAEIHVPNISLADSIIDGIYKKTKNE